MTVEFQVAAAKTKHGLILGSLLIVIGLGVLVFGGGSVEGHVATGGLALLLGLGVAAYVLWTGRRAGPQLRVDETGVWFKDWGLRVPWRDIEDAYQSGTRLQPFVTLRLRDPEAFLAGLGAGEAKALLGNRLWKAPELKIPNTAVEASQREVLDAVLAGLSTKERGASHEAAS